MTAVFRRLAILLLLSAVAFPAARVQAGALNVRVIVSDDTPPYREFSASLGKALAASGIDVAVAESQNGGGNGADLVVAVGAKAAELAIAKFDVPILAVMVSRRGYETLLESHFSNHWSKAVSAIYLDQPWERQLAFIQAALPRHKTVGLLYSSDARITLPRLPRGMSLNAQSTRPTENLFAALENVLSSSDVLLAVPDSEIYSSNNVRNILLTSYRYKVPLIGISRAYVIAGALGAIFSTPEQLAEQTGEAVVSFARNRRLPEPQYPALFSIALNPQVARSLEIGLDSPETIRERMNKAERGKQ